MVNAKGKYCFGCDSFPCARQKHLDKRYITKYGMSMVGNIVSKRKRKDFLRGIKEQRLLTFLGPLLKVITGKDIFTMWPGSEKALKWLNETRNRLAHGGEKADYSTAALGIFACVKTLTVLSQNQMLEADFTVEFF